MSLWLMREICCRFSTKSSLFTENPQSTSACPWDKVNTILKIVQDFLYLASPCIRSTKKESKRISFHQSLKRHLCVCSRQKKLVENIPFLLHQLALTRFDSNYTAYQLTCQNSWHISAYKIPCYEGRVRMCNVQFGI